ncbi:MAG: PhnD/SsuA/transferrin family substrate-binding protein [Pseudomonadota bacterium]
MHALAAFAAFDLAVLRPAHDALWQAVRGELAPRGFAHLPAKLARPLDERRLWTHPALLLGQIDAYRFAQVFPHCLAPVAAPHYDAPGCHGPDYRAVIVVRDDDRARAWTALEQRVAAVEGLDRLGSWRLFKAFVAGAADPAAFFGRVMISGGPVESLALVRSKVADYAILDCVSWAVVREHQPAVARGLRVVAETDPGLAPPFVSSLMRDCDERRTIYAALEAVLSNPAHAELRAKLRLKTIEPAEALDYEAEPRPVASTITLLSAARSQRET